MTIKIENLSIDADEYNYLGCPDGATDSINDETMRLDLLSIVRHIMRDERCDMIPVVRAFITHPTNQYGHNAQVEVTYAKRGYRAIYAARIGTAVTNVQCYMD